jgi:hypothetical protein
MTLSDIIKHKLRNKYATTRQPYLVDNKVVKFATPDPEAGKACMSCWLYHLRTELPIDTPPPEHKPVTLIEDIKPYRSKEPNLEGFCILNHPIIVTNVPRDYGCPYQLGKAKELQFEDDSIEDGTDLFAGPIGRKPVGRDPIGRK